MKAIIIIPTYNEAGTIEKTLYAIDSQLPKVSKHWQVEVLIVDDSSPDGTADVVERVAKKLKYVHLFSNPKKAGLGGAYLKGMEQAFGKMGADVVFEFDADLSHDPTKIPQFLQKIDDGYDMVLGSRYIAGGGIPEDWGLHRKFLSVVGNIVIMCVLTDFRVRDWTGGYRAITKRVYDAVSPDMHSERFTGYTFQLGFLHKALSKGFSVVEVPFKFADRTVGVSKMGAESIKNTLLYILKVRYKEITEHRVFKFAVVGGTGALTQLLSLHFYRYLLPVNHLSVLSAYQEAVLLSIETAVLVNFTLNNAWTFADRKLATWKMPFKFVQFNLASFGSIFIQFLISTFGEKVIGLFVLLTIPFTSIDIDTGLIFAVAGILIGMFWNFFAYSKFVWRKKNGE